MKKKVGVKKSENPLKSEREKKSPYKFSQNSIRESKIDAREKIKKMHPWKGKSAREKPNQKSSQMDDELNLIVSTGSRIVVRKIYFVFLVEKAGGTDFCPQTTFVWRFFYWT